MRVVLQRVSEAAVAVNTELIAQIGHGLLLLVGIEQDDEKEDIDWMVTKVVGMRIFSDEAGKMNLSVNEIKGDILVVSQFTLHASVKKGNRPSFIKAARPEQAVPLFDNFTDQLRLALNGEVYTGHFGANMQVKLVNDGPVTIIIDSKNKM